MKRITKLLVMLLVLSLLVTGCGASSGSEPAASETSGNEPAATEPEAEPEAKVMKDTLTIAHWQEPATLDPQYSNMISWFLVETQIFNGLVDYNDELGEYVPVLATSWEMIDDTHMVFNLRDDVMFQNGEKMTANDVYFTFKRATESPKSASSYKTLDIENTKVIDDTTIEVALKVPDEAFMNTLASGRGYIVSQKAVEEMGEAEFARNPVGTGHYQLTDWVSGTEIKMTAFANCFLGDPATPNLSFRFIPEASNRLIELETGGVDAALNIASTDVKRLNEMESAELVMVPSYRYTCITMSMKDELLSNKALREALVYSIDKELLTEVVYGETATALNGVMPYNAMGFKEMEATPYDLDLAKEKLAEAGYPDGVDVTFLVEPGSEYLDIAEAVQFMWKDAGINAELIIMDRPSYLAQGNEFQIAIRAGNANHPSNILIIYDSAFGDRIQGNDDYIDNGLVAFRQIYDDAKRQVVLDELQDYIWDIKYSIPVAHTNTIYGISANMEGFVPHPINLVDWSSAVVYE